MRAGIVGLGMSYWKPTNRGKAPCPPEKLRLLDKLMTMAADMEFAEAAMECSCEWQRHSYMHERWGLYTSPACCGWSCKSFMVIVTSLQMQRH